MGLSNSPSTFQRLMNQVFHDVLDDYACVYMDDILIYSETAELHESHLRDVFSRLREHELKCKRAKCEFGMTEVEYLGHVVGNG